MNFITKPFKRYDNESYVRIIKSCLTPIHTINIYHLVHHHHHHRRRSSYIQFFFSLHYYYYYFFCHFLLFFSNNSHYTAIISFRTNTAPYERKVDVIQYVIHMIWTARASPRRYLSFPFIRPTIICCLAIKRERAVPKHSSNIGIVCLFIIYRNGHFKIELHPQVGSSKSICSLKRKKKKKIRSNESYPRKNLDYSRSCGDVKYYQC